MKFGIRSAVDVVFRTTRSYTGLGNDSLLGEGKEWAKGEPVLYFDSLKTATTEGAANTVYAQGGAGNPRLIAWEGDKEVTFTFEDALISIEGMSILAGAGLLEASSGTKIRVHRKAVVKAGAEGAIDISAEISDKFEEALVTEDIFGFKVDGAGQITERLGAAKTTSTAEAVTFTEATIVEGDMLLIDFYVSRAKC